MLSLLVQAAPLSDKCKRSDRPIEGERAAASSVSPDSSPSRRIIRAVSPAVPASSPQLAETNNRSPQALGMTCITSRTAVPAFISEADRPSIVFSKPSPSVTATSHGRPANRALYYTAAATLDLEGTLLQGCMSPAIATYSPILLRPSAGGWCCCDVGGAAAAAETLKWCEARRIGSEPADLQSWVSAASLTECAGGGCREEDEDEVFTITYGEGDSWSTCDDDPDDSYEEDELWLEGWEELVIPSREISLTGLISHNCEETIFSGYWHGSVQVVSREARSGYDTRCFFQEVAMLNKIRHESIQLFMGITLDIGGGILGLVMSPLKGESLHTRLHVHGHQFSMSSKLKIVKQICEGMEYLHGRGICHGRLSTTTVHIHNRVCIKFRPQVHLPRCISCDDLVSLPPENIRSLSLCHGALVLPSPPSLKTDIFAFGTLLYELVLLGKPFRNVSRECVIWRVGSGHLQPLSLLPRDRLRGMIQRCWKLTPEARPTFKTILSDVEQNVLVFSPQTGNGLQRSLSLPSVLTDPPSPTLIC